MCEETGLSRQVVMSKERYTYLCVFVYMYAKSRFDERDTMIMVPRNIETKDDRYD